MMFAAREQYHLLSSDMTDNQIRLLISLRPDHKVSQVVKRLKGNLQHQLRKTFNSENVLAKGYFARSSGKIDLACARQYVESQTSHHGYKGEWTKPMKYRNETFKSPTFRFDIVQPFSTTILFLQRRIVLQYSTRL
jgi:hypothetical protein